MADKTTDILMWIKDDSGPVHGESTTAFDKHDDFTKDFEKHKFFELEDFDFGIGLDDSDSSSKSSAQPPRHSGTPAPNQNTVQAPRGPKFSNWIQGGPSASYPIQMEEVAITREIGAASPVLFQKCFKTLECKSAALVMRKVGGLAVAQSDAGKHIAALPFLRIDFSPVLITTISWDVGDYIKEKLKFVCRNVQVQYRVQTHHGTGDIVIKTDVLSQVKSTNGGSNG
jgi:type VI protein secretion system component Hcp